MLAFLVAAPAAHAAPPIMPLSEVERGMDCTGLSVIRGTEVSSFDVEILDVIAPEAGLSGPRILIRVSGPAVDSTGVGPGFSGSPIMCDGRNAGAISEGLGEYGNDVALATPIEEMLRDRPTAPSSARRDPELLRAGRPFASPLSVSGATGRTAELLRSAAARARRPLLIAPAGPAGGYAPVDLQPGSAMAVTLATGDLGLGAVGTVTYRDGDDIWAFGHPFEGIGKRALFLQDAYVYTVIENPIGVPDFGAVSYKLASTDGNLVGSITDDSIASVSGKVGPHPRSFPFHVSARNRAGRTVMLDSLLADERHLGWGAGINFVAPLGLTEAITRLMRDFGPTTLRMCAHFKVRQLRRPMGFCNPYFAVDDAVADLSEAGSLVDFFDLAPLDVQRVAVSVRARSGVKRDVIVRARGPRRARKGSRIRVRLTVQRRNGRRQRVTVRVRVPRHLEPGRTHRLTLRGGAGGGFSDAELIEEFLILIEGGGEPSSEPTSVRQLARRIRGLRRRPGIEARWNKGEPRLVETSGSVAYEGRARLRIRVTPRRR